MPARVLSPSSLSHPVLLPHRRALVKSASFSSIRSINAASVLSLLRSPVFFLTILAVFVFILSFHSVPTRLPQFSTPDLSSSSQLSSNSTPALERFLRDLPGCSGSGRARTFLMLFMGRSGSTAIMTSLKQHSQTYIEGFEPIDFGIYRAGDKKTHSMHALNYTYRFFRNATSNSLTPGFKARPENLLARPTEFSRLISKFQTRIIWSYRLNVFKQAIGDYAIHYLNDTTSYEGLKVKPNSTRTSSRNNATRNFTISNMTKFHALLKLRTAGDQKVFNAVRAISVDHCVLPVSYESFLKYPDLTMLRIQRFLGLDFQSHQILRAKANDDAACTQVSNWNEMCHAFFACPKWRWMLDDFENGCSCSHLKLKNRVMRKDFCDDS